MNSLTIDTKMLRENILKCPNDTESGKVWESEGEEYLYRNIISKCINDIPFTVSDIDFSAFDEDDIVAVIDDKISDIEDVFCTVGRISAAFEDEKSLKSELKKFF